MALVNTLVVRFRVYAPDGAVQGVLPHPLSWEAGIPLNDMPSLNMTYPDGSDAANLLKSPCEVALELRDPITGTFTEYPGCRFINIRRSVDLADRPRIISFTMPSYGWMLKKVRWMDPDNPRLNKENQIVYRATMSAATPLVDIVNLAHARGNVPGLTVPFTPFFDSNGDGWPEIVRNVSFDYGQDAWSILDSFSRQGFFDWRMNKRALECFKTDGALKRLLDTDTGVHIHSMLATTEEPVERTWEEVAGTAVAIGDQGLTAGMVVMPDNPTNYPWGKWDEAISASGVKDVQVLAQITDNLLATKYKARTQYTKKFTWTEGAPVPLVDYRPGDFIRAMSDATSGAQKASMRIYQVTLSGTDPYGVGISLTLNDRFTDRALQQERWIARASNGGGPVGGGGTGAGGGKPPAQPVDTTLPKAPVLNTVTNDPYFSELGDPVSMADVAFTVVTQDINNREIDMSRYIVLARRSDFNWQQARTVTVPQPDSPSTGQVIHAKIPLLDSGYSYEFRVQAVRLSGYVSDPSNAITQTMAYPTTPLELPSAPILSSKLSTVKAEWDGKDNTGAPYPPEFREVQVEVSINNSTWFHAGDIFSPGASIIMSGKGGTPTWNVGDTVYVRFKAMNSAAVITGISAVASIVVLGVVGPDIAANTITANNIVAGTLTAQQIKAHSLSVESLSVGNPNNVVVDPTFSSATLNTARLTQAIASSATSPTFSQWSIIANTSIKIENNSATSNFNRFGFTNNSLVNYPLQTFPGPSLTSNELAIPITRPGNTDGALTGNVKCRFVVTATGIPASPGAATINVAMLTRQFQSSGAPVSTAGVIQPDFTISTNGTYTIESVTGWNPAAGTVSYIPYLYVKFENGVGTDVALEFTQIEIWQESSVYIGNGLIKTPLLAANAVTTDILNADAITAKHSIRSAYYEMVSQSGAAVIKITENANFAGQSGIRWDGLTNYGPRIFQADASGTGGWDPRGFVITGPEQTTNSSGRVDMQFAYGIANSKITRQYGTETISYQGIYWDTSTARFRIGGMFNTGHYNNDMFRMDRVGFQNGTYSYGVVTTRRYYPILCPNGGTTPVTSSIYQFPSGTEGGFQYVSSSGVSEVFFIAMCGTP
ncbi:MAG: hypothetical protein ABFE01_08885 [Phycisphaerales bacterium]